MRMLQQALGSRSSGAVVCFEEQEEAIWFAAQGVSVIAIWGRTKSEAFPAVVGWSHIPDASMV